MADPQLPQPTDGWVYTDRFLRAFDTAARLHATQVGKGSGVSYISHLLGTCSIVLAYGADEDEAIAALLHDAIEDVQPTGMARAAVASFGPRVLAIVEGCTKHRPLPKRPWRERKERYIQHLATADASVLLVAGADKLHNPRSLVADVRHSGPSVWDRFNAGRTTPSGITGRSSRRCEEIRRTPPISSTSSSGWSQSSRRSWTGAQPARCETHNLKLMTATRIVGECAPDGNWTERTPS